MVLTRSGGVPAGAVSVAAYGARGDGATDDTKAIGRALSAATAAHKALYFPAGTYKVGALALPRGADLVGAGAARSWLSGRLEIAGTAACATWSWASKAPPCTSPTAPRTRPSSGSRSRVAAP